MCACTHSTGLFHRLWRQQVLKTFWYDQTERQKPQSDMCLDYLAFEV